MSGPPTSFSSGSTPKNGVELTGAELRALGPFVRLERIKAGDVMLMLGGGVQAKATAGLSGGEFSHAAIWLPVNGLGDAEGRDGWPSVQLVEADPHGVGPTPTNVILLREEDHWTSVACFPGTVQLRVVRHPRLAAIESKSLRRIADRFQQAELYRSYSPFSRLVAASTLPVELRPIAATIMAQVDTRRLYLPGAFCSELVAKFFLELNLPLFDPHLSPHLVAPSRLADKNCFLIAPSPPVVIAPSDIADDARAWRSAVGRHRDRASDLAPLVQQSEATTKLSVETDAVRRKALDQMSRHLARSRELERQQFERLEADLRQGRPFETPSMRETLLRLYAQANLLRSLDAVIAPLELQAELGPALRTALQSLRSIHIQLNRDLSNQALHHTVVYGLRVAGAVDRVKNRADRRNIVREWRRQREDQRRTSVVLDQLRPLSSGDPETLATPECQAHVSGLLASACEQAQAHLQKLTYA